jgi:nucleoside-diphosphate-sugar epimerase
LKKGSIPALGSAVQPWTQIHAEDVAHCLALAVDEPRAVGRRIDLGSDRPVSAHDIAAGPVPTFENSLRRALKDAGFLDSALTEGNSFAIFIPYSP